MCAIEVIGFGRRRASQASRPAGRVSHARMPAAQRPVEGGGLAGFEPATLPCEVPGFMFCDATSAHDIGRLVSGFRRLGRSTLGICGQEVQLARRWA